jgi:predicted small lipoprotein YifL
MKNFAFIALLILSLSLNALASGCGKKGPPVPPDEEKSLTTVEPSADTPSVPDAESGSRPPEQP